MDNILEIFPGGASGFFGNKIFDIVAIAEGLLLVQITKTLVNEAVIKAREASKESNEGFLKKMASVISSGSTLLERYGEKSKEEIINETPGNLFIPKASLKKVKISRKTDSSQGSAFSDSTEIKIVWTEGKIKLTFSKILNVKETKRFFKDTFGI
jgi:hypothetical protein